MRERPRHHSSQPRFTRRTVIGAGLGLATFGGLMYVLGRGSEPPSVPKPVVPAPEAKPTVNEYARLEQKIKGLDARTRSRQEFEANAQEVAREAVKYYANEIALLTGERPDEESLLRRITLYRDGNEFARSMGKDYQSCMVKPIERPNMIGSTTQESKNIEINLPLIYEGEPRRAHQRLFGTLLHELSHADVQTLVPTEYDITIENMKILRFNGFFIKVFTGGKPEDREACQGEVAVEFEEAYAEYIAQKLVKKVNIVRDNNPYLRLAANMENLLNQLSLNDTQIVQKMVAHHRKSQLFEFATAVSAATGYNGDNAIGQGITVIGATLAA